jgi:hypothetical protein
MRRLFSLAILFIAAPVLAQTTLDITVPGNTVCSYTTGPVTTGSPAGHLQATATSSTGAGCGSSGGSVSFGPASPLAPAQQVIGNQLTGNAASATFQAVNATQCTASITGASGGTFASGVVSGSGTASATVCNTGAGCQTQQNLGMSFPYNSSTTIDNTYTVTATCAGTGGNVNSVATVTVPHGISQGSCLTIPSSTTGITNFTRLTGNKSVNYYGAGNSTVDITSFSAVFKKAWPGTYGLAAQFTLPTSNYMSLQFTVPNGFISTWPGPGPLYGDYSVDQSGYNAPITFTISTTCGDFANPATNPTSTVVSGCYTNKAQGGGVTQWRNDTRCILSDNTTYFLNIINADVTNVTANGGGTAASTKNANCSASTCNDPIEDGPGTWSGWTGTHW